MNTRLALPQDIDPVVLARLIQNLEAGIHREGWSTSNDHMQLFILHEETRTGSSYARLFSPIVRDGSYCLSRMLGRGTLDVAGLELTESLRRMVIGMAYNKRDYIQTMLHTIAIPGVIALLSTHEAWVRSLTFDEFQAGRNKDYSEMPDTQEARIITCIDAWDRAHTLLRIRGEKPKVTIDAPLRGDVSTSLRILMDAIYGRLPSQEEYDSHYPTIMENARKILNLHQDETLPPDPFLTYQGEES